MGFVPLSLAVLRRQSSSRAEKRPTCYHCIERDFGVHGALGLASTRPLALDPRPYDFSDYNGRVCRQFTGGDRVHNFSGGFKIVRVSLFTVRMRLLRPST